MYWKRIYKYLFKLLPLLFSFMIIFFIFSLYLVFFKSPLDYRQYEYVKIMYIHVPAAWIAMLSYLFTAIMSFIFIVWNNRYCNVFAYVSASIGCMFCTVCLLSGSIWGKMIWGTWWIWDARLTSMLSLFLIYIVYLLLWSYGGKYEKMASLFAVLGSINLPIIHFSVIYFRTLHQTSSIFRKGGIAMDYSMLVPLMCMFAAFSLFSLVVAIIQATTIFNIKKIHTLENTRYIKTNI